MLVNALLNKIHLRFEKNTAYPDSTSEDFLVRLGYIDDGITMWENEVRDGVLWNILLTQASIISSGTGTDLNETDFLNFVRAKDTQAIITNGSDQWTEVSSEDGNFQAQNNLENHIFWLENGSIRTLPAISGTITFPYIRKATRYPLGTEATTMEIPDDMFLQEFCLAMLYLDDGNMNQYQSHMNNAVDSIEKMKFQEILPTREASTWGMGM